MFFFGGRDLLLVRGVAVFLPRAGIRYKQQYHGGQYNADTYRRPHKAGNAADTGDVAQVHAGDVGLGEQDAVIYWVGIALGNDAFVQDCDDTMDNLQMVIRSVVDNDVAHLEAVVVVAGADKAQAVGRDIRLHRAGLNGTEAQTGHQEEAEDNQKDKNGGRYDLEELLDWMFRCMAFCRRGLCIRLLRHFFVASFLRMGGLYHIIAQLQGARKGSLVHKKGTGKQKSGHPKTVVAQGFAVFLSTFPLFSKNK